MSPDAATPPAAPTPEPDPIPDAAALDDQGTIADRAARPEPATPPAAPAAPPPAAPPADPATPPAAAPPPAATPTDPATPPDVRPTRNLWLLVIAHAFNHAQVAVLPLVYLAIIDEWGVTVAQIAFLTAASSLASGAAQLSYSGLTRRFSRRGILGFGNLLFGGAMAAQGLTSVFPAFAAFNITSFIGASQQHPVGNGLLSEQFPPHRRGFAISSHIAGGNIGTVAVPLIGAWLIAGVGWGWTVILFGIPPLLIGIAILALLRESGTDRAAALAHGSLRSAFGQILRDRDLLLLFASSMLGGGARGLGVLNLFIPLYLSLVLGVDTGTVAAMMTVLLLGSVPGPIVAGWLSDRIGRKPMIVAIYVFGAISILLFISAGSNLAWIWATVILLAIFSFVESPQLQALLADMVRPGLRDASFSLYFTLAFGVGAMWTAIYGAITGALGNEQGLPVVFVLMALAYLAAAFVIMPIRAEQRAAAARAEELALIAARTPGPGTPPPD